MENPIVDDGYTSCCNELECHGNPKYKFGVPTDYVVACCWAKAHDKFEAEGREVPVDGYRLD
jgi:hypothetical protein